MTNIDNFCNELITTYLQNRNRKGQNVYNWWNILQVISIIFMLIYWNRGSNACSDNWYFKRNLNADILKWIEEQVSYNVLFDTTTEDNSHRQNINSYATWLETTGTWIFFLAENKIRSLKVIQASIKLWVMM